MSSSGAASGGGGPAAFAFGTAAARPAAAVGNAKTAYYATDTGEVTYSDGAAWHVLSATSGSFAVLGGNNLTATGGTLNVGSAILNGFFELSRTPVADVDHAQGNEMMIAYTSITAARAVTLINNYGVPGAVVIVKDESGNASAGNTITVSVLGGGTIDGAATKVINTAFGEVRVYWAAAGKWLTW